MPNQSGPSAVLLLKDIRFWIILFFAVRLIGITNPPLEISHNWRQTCVTMVARNFLEVDNNIFYPRMDIAGEKTGITGMEFPILNYIIYLTSLIFGYEHWYGRLINLIVSSIGIWFFYKIIRKYFTSELAFYSALILICSIWFMFSRKIMPSTFAMSLALIGAYHGTNYLDPNEERSRPADLLLYFVFVTMGMLSKIPSGFFLVIFVFFLMMDRIDIKKKILFSVSSLAALSITVFWYFQWVPYLVKEYGYQHFFMGDDLVSGAKEVIQNFAGTLERFYSTSLKFVGFAVFVFGLVIAIARKNQNLLFVFILCALSFSLIVIKSGFNFSHHSYYVIPFVPVMALIAGYGLSTIKSKALAYVLLAAICIESGLNQIHDFRIPEKYQALLELEKDLNMVSTKEDLILINSEVQEHPTPMYFANRKGWNYSNEQISDMDLIASLKTKGLKYIVILKNVFGTDRALPYKLIKDTDDYRIYAVD